MSLKFKGIKASISSLASNFLRLSGMSDSEPLESLPCLFFHQRSNYPIVPVDSYKDHILSYISDMDGKNTYMQCLLLRVEHYKCLQNVEREFLVLHFTHWTSPSSEAHTAVICVDRYINTYPSNSSQSSGLTTTPSLLENVEDMIMLCCTRYSTKFLRWRFKSFKQISSMSFPSNRPSALEISILLDLVSQQDISYVVSRWQSHWFCETVCKSLERLFHGVEQLCGTSTRWHLGTISPVERTSEEDINAVCNGYPTAMQMAVLHMNQLEIQREAAREQIREEGRALAQLQLEELDRQLEERDRQLEEIRAEQQRENAEHDRRIEEMRAEIERMRAQFTASKDTQ